MLRTIGALSYECGSSPVFLLREAKGERDVYPPLPPHERYGSVLA